MRLVAWPLLPAGTRAASQRTSQRVCGAVWALRAVCLVRQPERLEMGLLFSATTPPCGLQRFHMCLSADHLDLDFFL
jgi:hypothetical protein